MKKASHIKGLSVFTLAAAISIILPPALISTSIASKSQIPYFWQTSHKVSGSISDDNCLRPQSCFSTATQYLKEGKNKKAALLFKKIQELYPYTTWRSRAAYTLGRELLKDEPAGAETFLKKAMVLSDINDYILFDLAASYRYQEKKEGALAIYDLLLNDHPESLLAKTASFEKARMLIEMDNWF